MDIGEAVTTRRSIRKYQGKEIPCKILKELLNEALWAPSGSNRQNWDIVVVRGKKKDELLKVVEKAGGFLKPRLEKLFPEKMVNITLQFFKNLGGAPVVILVYMPKLGFNINSAMSTLEKYQAEHQRFSNLCSASALVQNILLLAKSRGLGTCWMTAPKYVEDEINQLLEITDRELVAVVPLGYPDQNPPAPPRKGDKIRWIGFD